MLAGARDPGKDTRRAAPREKAAGWLAASRPARQHPPMRLQLLTRTEPVRRSILLAMGLLGACGGDDGGATQASAGSTTTAPATSAPTSSTTDPTSGTTGPATSGDAGTGSASASTGGTSTSGTTTGGDTTGTSAATSDGSSGTTGVAPECVPLMQGMTDPPVPSGWVKCGDQLPHRVEAEVCLVPAAPSSCNLDEPGQPCHTNADCTEFPFGSCQQTSVGLLTCLCAYGCETDADCAPGEVCRCAGDILGPYARCVPSSCTDDGDCGDELCQFSQSQGYDCGPEVVNGACTTPDDVCDSDLPCGESPCAFVDGKWQCSLLACGRPFIVDDHAVTAPPAARDDWRAPIVVAAAPAALRPALAAHWTRIALAEHASVASFARHLLELLAVGAPAELVQAAQQALADEVEHARVCFALAGAHAGAAVGPGPLTAAAPVAGDLESVVAAVLREACVGETLSALEAREAAERAEDPALRRLLARIADDEQRHAELGWRFVRWALARMDADARTRAHATLAAAVAAAAAEADALASAPAAAELRPHGVVDPPLRAAVWREGLTGLVLPASAALRAAA